jgi:ribulose-5-phosphate 4-epimerase/fuculose-1-phosphate aldolase
MCSAGHNPGLATEHAPSVPTSPTPATNKLVDELVLANHILFHHGVVDAFGHVSVRHDARADRFLLSCNIAPGLVSCADIVEFNLDGDPLNANGRRVYLERFIHSEIYRARPDVQAVVHSHSHAIVPLTTVKDFLLRPIFHMAGFIGKGAPVFEIRDVGGDDTDLLISNQKLGRALANMFQGNSIVLMRGHGSTVVAETLQKVVYRAVYADINARYLLEASKLGPVTFLTEAESNSCAENIEAQIHRPWDLWTKQVRQRQAEK